MGVEGGVVEELEDIGVVVVGGGPLGVEGGCGDEVGGGRHFCGDWRVIGMVEMVKREYALIVGGIGEDDMGIVMELVVTHKVINHDHS